VFRLRRRRLNGSQAGIRDSRLRNATPPQPFITQAAVEQAHDIVKQRLLLPDDAVRLLDQMVTDMEASKLFAK